ACEGVFLATERDEFGCASEELDQLGRQRPAGVCLPTAGERSGATCGARHGDAGECEADGEHDRRSRKDERGRDDAGESDDESDEGRPHGTQVEPLQGVDVTDHATYEIAPAKRLE